MIRFIDEKNNVEVDTEQAKFKQMEKLTKILEKKT